MDRKNYEQSFLQKHREGILYLLCGFLTVVINLLMYVLFIRLGLEINLANIFSSVIAAIFVFTFNKWIVFLSKYVSIKLLIREIALFSATRIIPGIITIIGFPLLLKLGLDQSISGIEGIVAKIIIIIIVLFYNYIAIKYFVYKKIN